MATKRQDKVIQKKQILLVNYEYPPLGGGAGNATAHIASELTRLGVEVIVMTSSYKSMPVLTLQDGYHVLRVSAVRRHTDRCTPPEMMTFLFSASFSAFRLARKRRPDAVITFFGIPCGPVGLVLKLLFGIPYVVSLRGGDVPGFQPYDLAIYHKLTGPFIDLIWRRACAVVANSSGLKALAERFDRNLPIYMIPNGVDTRFFTPTTSQPGNRPVRILFVGRLVYQKGVDKLLEAVARMPSVDRTVLKIVGDGDLRVRLEGVVLKLGLHQVVSFEGWCKRSEIVNFYQWADIFVLPSRDEGLSNALLEAMACGLPVVATKIAGNEEVVQEGETGLLVPPGDSGALNKALNELVQSEALRRKMGEKARALVKKRYTWRKVSQDYLSLIAESCFRH